MRLVPKRKLIIPKDAPAAALQDIISNITENQSTIVQNITNLEAVSTASGIVFVIDGGGAEIADGVAGYITVPFDCEILAVELLADTTGSIKIDIWKDSIANFPPTNADTITAGSEPEISSGTSYFSSALTGWTKTLERFRNLAFNVDSCTDITKCTLILHVERDTTTQIDISDGSVAVHAALTETHGATGAIVGTTNTQTLFNKSFGELRLVPKTSSTGAEGTIYYDSEDNYIYVATE